MLFGVVWWNYQLAIMDHQYPAYQDVPSDLPALPETDYKSWLKSKGYKSSPLTEEDVSFGQMSGINLEADFLKEEVPVLCVIMSKGRNKANAVKNTWGKHCNQIIFFGSYSDSAIPVVRYSSLESSHVSFCQMIVQIRKQFDKTFKWLLLAQDSSYVLVENARHYVAPLDHRLPYYLGRTVQKYSTPSYNSPDSTILLSSGAYDLLTNDYFTTYNACRKVSFKNDTLLMSRSYEVSLGAIFNRDETNDTARPTDTRDSKGRARFLPFMPERHIIRGLISIFNSYWRTNVFSIPQGKNCCSDYAISFDGFSPSQLYLTEYLLYHLSPFKTSQLGIGNKEPMAVSDYRDDIELERKLRHGMPEIKLLDKKRKKYDFQDAADLMNTI
ncbi:Glycoprotein-N-acetylgalactosamine 3-beta-galactosyltransferase 1 [Halotydeus destructor]|nr:Glycoprotein-N-acetylgalactosamine 3-beta-galactosyltransferase 1 [Halotydeus destructor]